MNTLSEFQKINFNTNFYNNYQNFKTQYQNITKQITQIQKIKKDDFVKNLTLVNQTYQQVHHLNSDINKLKTTFIYDQKYFLNNAQ